MNKIYYFFFFAILTDRRGTKIKNTHIFYILWSALFPNEQKHFKNRVIFYTFMVVYYA